MLLDFNSFQTLFIVGRAEDIGKLLTQLLFKTGSLSSYDGNEGNEENEVPLNAAR